MAATAQQDMQERVVEVDRKNLVVKLKDNKKKHIDEYNEAIANYKQLALEKLEAGYKKAKVSLDKQVDLLRVKINQFDESSPDMGRGFLQLVDAITVDMPVPRNYTEEYDAAIAIAEADVNETLELSYAEFTCFYRDKWSWKTSFETTMCFYNGR